MANQIQVRRGTAAQWTAANPVLAAGEPGLETDTGLVKIGDGATAWAALPVSRRLVTEASGDSRYPKRDEVVFLAKDHGVVADGVTDDTVALNALLTLAAGKGAVELPIGTCLIGSTKTLLIPSNTELRGRGDGSVLKFAASPVVTPIANAVNAGFMNVWLHDFKIDGNKAAIAAATGGNPDVNGTAGTGNNTALWLSSADATPATNIYLDRITLVNSFRLGIVIQNVQDGRVNECSVSGNNRDGITLYYNCQNMQITDNRITGCGDDHIGLNAEDGTSQGHLLRNIVIRGNRIFGPSPRNKGKGIAVRGASRVNITGNTIDSTSETAIYLSNWNSSNLDRVTVTGNTVYNAGSGGSANKYGILAQANNANTTIAGRGKITRLAISGNTISGCGGDGILVDNAPAGLTPAGFTGAVDGDIQHVTISGNSITDNTGNGVWIGSSPIVDVAISGNNCSNNTQNGIAVIGSAGPSPHKRVAITGNIANTNGVNGINADTVAVLAVTGNVSANNTSNGLRVANLTLSAQFSPNSLNGNSNPIAVTNVASTIVMQQHTNSGGTFGKVTIGATAAGASKALNDLGLAAVISYRTPIAADYTALNTDSLIAVGAIAGPITITLPAASTMPVGAMLVIKDENGNAATKNIKINAATGEGIDGYTATSMPPMSTNYQVVRLYVRGTSGWAIA